MSERNIHKTIRITQEAYDYIDSFSGTTWNDKVNNMIDHVLHHEDDRRAKISSLENQIVENKEKLNQLETVIRDAKKALGVNSYW